MADAIDLISTQFSSINPKIFNNSTKLFEDTHPILDLLKNPNNATSYIEFAEQCATFFELTGNCYWIMGVSMLGGPISLYCVPPQQVNVVAAKDGYPAYYEYNVISSGDNMIGNTNTTFLKFYRKDTPNNDNVKVIYSTQDDKFQIISFKKN